MHFWRKESFSTLKDVAAKARAVPLWSDYADSCVEYERGLRSEAFIILDRFISSMEHAPFADRRRFVSWLSWQADGREGRDMLIPQPLQIRLVEPTLVEWTMAEPCCFEPRLWLGGYDHVKRAFELEPDNQLARRKLIILILAQVDYASHELPGGYLGEIPRKRDGRNGGRHTRPDSPSEVGAIGAMAIFQQSPTRGSPERLFGTRE